jgi:predicted N-acyltransferase
MPLKAEVIGQIADVPAADWDALALSGHPFLRHAFLDALEATGCVGETTGWLPAHIVVRDEVTNRLVAAVPQYLKTHSWGEFVFDWSWAQSYLRAGLEYYPKQLAAIPFTPVTGPRLLVAPSLFQEQGVGEAGTGAFDAYTSSDPGDIAARVRQQAAADALRGELATLLQEVATRSGASGAHVNFTIDTDQVALERAGFMRRHDCRFLWRNRGYGTFDDFLGTFRADKRKKVKRERRKVVESGISFRTLRGEEIDRATWSVIFGFSERTFLRHGNGHYLNIDFLLRVASAMPGAIMVKVAERQGEPIAAAIFFEGGGWLYGRYWGTARHEDSLHFEACYYQGIDYCIEHGLDNFDPGTQGEHKIARGFEPTRTTSAHWLEHTGFADAVGRYLARERVAIDAYIGSAQQHLPFQRGESV